MSQRTKMMITREGWYYLGMLGFIIAGAVIRDINLLYIMAGMMMGPMLYSIYASTKSLRRLTIRRRFPSLVSVGSPMYVEIAVEKPTGSSPAFATIIRDEIRRKGARRSSAKMSLFFPHIAAGGSADASYRACLQRRGEYLLGPLRASTGMPLGLVRATIVDSEIESVLVSPQLGELSPAWSRRLDLRKDGSQRSVRRRGKAGGDFYGLGEWRNGDSRSWIHWRTSAKRNKLTVRQFEKRINQDLIVILDLWHPRDAVSPNQAVEMAISFAATLLFEYGKHGSTHMVIASVSRSSFELQGTSSPVLRQELMERLAVVEPTSTDTLSDVLIHVMPRATRNAKVVLVSTTARDLNDTVTFESVWKRTDIRRSLGDIVKVNTSAPEVADWFRLVPRDARFSESLPLASDSASLAPGEQAAQ